MKFGTFVASAALALSMPISSAAYTSEKHAPPAGDRLAQQSPPTPAPTPAPAPAPTAHIEVLVLEATSNDGGVAPGLSNLPQLRQPPFSAYSQISIVSRATLQIGAAPASTALPSGAARITLSGRSPEGRFTVNVAFVQGAQTSNIQFVAAVGEPFFTVRSSRPDRALVVGFIVRP